MADNGINPTQTRSTDAILPNVGVKKPSQGKSTDTTSGNVKSKYGKKPKMNRRGRSGDALNSDGAIATTGGGMSMGSKADDTDFWAGSAFAKR
jgi:hypothetical protein